MASHIPIGIIKEKPQYTVINDILQFWYIAATTRVEPLTS